MKNDKRIIEEILVNGLTHVLKRTVEVNSGDQLALAQEYKEWINCLTASDFSAQDILIIDNFTFK